MIKFPIKLIYVAGPLSAETKEGIAANVARSITAGKEVWRVGGMAIIPHLNSPSSVFGGVMAAESVYLADLELLDRCDAVFRISGWENSRGTCYETAWANFRQIPVFDEIEALEKWLNGGWADNNVSVVSKHDVPSLFRKIGAST